MSTSATQTQTFQLILKAQDEATSAIQSVGAQLDKLGENTSLAKLSELISAQTVAMGEALTQQTEMLKEALGEQEVAEREHEGIMSRLREGLEKPIEFAKVAIGVEAGLAAFSAFSEGIHELPRAFAEATSESEAFSAQMQNFYGSTENAGRVLEYTNAQAMRMPFSIASIRTAVANLSATGQNVGQLLPALGNLAAAMHTTLPAAVDAFNRSLLTGNLRGLQSQLRVSRGTLESFGLAVDTHGKIIASTLAPALERLASTRFGDAMARQGETAQGGLVRIANAFDLFKDAAGSGLMRGLGGPLKTVTDWLATHQKTVEHWGEVVGTALAKAGAAAIWLATKLGPPIMAAIGLMVAAWKAAEPAISRAIGVIIAVAGQVGTFLHDKVLPVVFAMLGQMAAWWDAHAKQIGQILGAMWAVIQTFFGTLQANMSSTLNILHGLWEIGWGLVSGVLGSAIDLMTGNWQQFGQDIKSMAGTIATGIVDIFAGMVERVVGILGHLTDPLSDLSSAFFRFASGAASALYSAFVGVQGAVVGVINGLIGTVDDAIRKIDSILPKHTVTTGTGKGRHRTQVQEGVLPTIGSIAQPQEDPAVLQSLRDLANKRLTFGATSDQAVKNIEQMKDALDAQIHSFLGMPSAQRETQQGRSLWDRITDMLGKLKLTMPSFDLGKLGGLLGLLGGRGEGGAGAAATDGSKALQDAYSAAQKHLEADLERNMPLSVLLADRERIRGAMVALKDSADDIFLEMTSTMKQVQDHIHQAAQAALDKARQTLQYEEVLGLPYKTLLAQVNHIMKALSATGVAPGSLEYRATYKQLIDEINKQGGGGTSPAVPSPAYGTYGGLATGYGQTTVSFGGTQQSGWAAVVAELRAQLAFWRSRALAEQRQLDAQQQTAQNTAQIAQNTQPAADKMDQSGRGLAHVPAATAVRGAGGFQVMRRV